ncbi:gliding motility-associated C-terminal domain-containing protein [Pedobacter punctiformis]|uniref:Gliding motility-associated C-terminal domain-containing protein n=1 Tax=Pedobacter punctiformis TaxID=3004097 RepID=A0ABT4LB36_9SPHI|nr:gliding motility-associated C-terminal domain-containing protein [Pedobacter sp. HCMS5-2]MCZ4245119.1 gliding motility-associated C-terminal domain-containing protein [Pedobacter sp. HCMS5-2]
MKKIYALPVFILQLLKTIHSNNKYSQAAIINKRRLGLFILSVLIPFLGFAQNATPILDLNSPKVFTNGLSTNASNLNDPPGNGWTQNSANIVFTPVGVMSVDQDNPNFTSTSPALTNMNLGPSPSGAGQIIVGIGFNDGAPSASSGSNTATISYGGVAYARLTTAVSGNGSVTYLNGATNASGTTVATTIAPTPYKSWVFTMITINLPNGVVASGNIVLSWQTATGAGADDIAFDYVIANRYAGDGNYNFANTFIENGSAVSIADTDMSIADDGTNMSGATITLTNPQASDALSVLGALPAGITAALSAGNTVVTLSGTASIANYETAIKQIRFANSSESPNTTNRTVNVVVLDASAVASNTAVTTITITPVNDPPSGTDKTISVAEDATYTFSAADFGFTDPIENNNFKSVTISTLPANGTLKLNGVNVTLNQVILLANIPLLTWTQTVADANGNAFSSFTFRVTDDGGTTNGGIDTDPTANTITFNVTPVADITNDVIGTFQNTPVAFNVVTGTGGATADSFENVTRPVTSITQPASGGSVTFSANGNMTFTPTTGFTGTTSFTYTVTSGGVTETATVTLNVTTPAPCNSGLVYSVESTTQQGLYLINPATEATTLVQANLFGGGAAQAAVAAGADDLTSAIALDMSSNTIWFCNRGNAIDPLPKIFSYNLSTNIFGVTFTTFTGVVAIANINKAAYNSIDKQIYFHNATNNHLYRFNPATPTTPAIDLGTLSIPGFAATANYTGGDIAFDGLGNLTGVFTNANVMAIFPAQYDASGNYTGLSLTGQVFTNLTGAISSVAFLSDGNYLVGGAGGTSNVNSTTGVVTDLGATNFASADFASCAAPAPNLIHRKSASVSCSASGSTITYTITVQNNGQFHAINSRLIDALPAGVTVNSATLNGVAIAGISNAALTAGILIKSTNAPTNGQILKGETATIILNCTASNTGTSVSNQSFVKYNGIETLNLTNDQLPSDDPSTVAANDPTLVTLCSSITGTVFTDNDGQTGGVNGTAFSGATVTLYAADGTTILGTTVTDASGNYTFGVMANNYVVGVTLPTGYQHSSSTDATPLDGKTAVTVAANVTGLNFGIRQVADVSITKTAGSGTPNVGSNVTFTLTAANAGPSSATNVSATDVLPSGYTFVSATPSGSTTYNNATGVWTIGTLANGANATLNIVATVKATGSYANTATITSTETDPTPGNNTSTSTPVPVPVADVSITKTAGSGTPNVGSNVTFTLTAANAGPSSATNVNATDVLPSGYTFVSATPSGSTTYNNATGVWTIGTLANGANATLNIVATVKATGSYANTATITSTETDPTPGNNTSTSTPVPVPVADVSITKTSGSGTPNVGSNVTFTLTAANAGPSSATNVNATDVLPSGYTFVSATPSGSTTYNNATGVWTIGTLANGANATLNIVATVKAAGSYANTATITATETDPTPGNNTSTSTPVPVPVADVSITKTSGSGTPNVGSNVTFTLTAANAGPSSATNVNATDVLPSGYTFVSATPSGSTTYNNATGVWTIGTLANGANATLNIVATVKATGSYANTATITSTETDPTPGNNTSTSTPVPVPVVDVSITKTAGSGTPNVGSNVTFTLTAANAGPSSATNVNATDVLPSGYTFVSATPSGSTTYNNATGVWTIGTLANGANATLNIVATVKATGSYANTITITSTETDPTPGNNTSTSTPVPVPVADVSITKTAGSGTPNVGSNVTFTLTAANAGPSSATNVSATDVLPSGYTFVSATPSGSTTYNNATGVWTIGTLANGANATLNIVATVKATGSYANTATITSTETDPTPGNNTSTSTPVPVPVADVSITKTAGSGTPNVGSNVTFTLTAANAGPSSATNVNATDVLPSGYTFVSATPSGSTTYNNATGVWTIGTLANGANATLNIVATVKATGSYANTATITSTETDPTPGNNTSTSTPVPVPVADVSITKTSGSGTPNVGSNVTFTLTAANAGPSSATNVSATDVLPSGYTFVSATPSGSTTYNNATGAWTIGTLANGGNATLNIVATVKATGAYANTATITSTETDSTPGNNTSTSTPVPVPVADVSITKTSGSGTPNVGSNVTFTLTAANAGPSSATNVNATDLLPSGYTFVSATPSGSTSYSSTTGLWTIGTLANGANATLNIVAMVNATGNYANTATITSTETDPTPGNNTATSTPAPVPVADVSISKTSNGASSNVGDNVTFTLTASNAGPSSATNVSATDVLPSGYTFVSATPSASTTYNSSTGLWTIGTLANGANATLNIVATIKANGSYANVANITATENDPNTANNTSTVTLMPGAVANVAISKTVSNGTPNVGSNVTFTLTASNAGPSDATGVNVSDLLPTGYTFVSATPSGSTSYSNSTGLWTIGNLINGANATLNIVASVNATGSYANTATITGNETDPNTANNTSTATTSPVPVADVSITKTAGSGTPNVGSNVTFTLTAANAGPSSATNVNATDVLPSGYTFVSATPSGSTTYNNATGLWTIGTLANGANATLNIVATVKATGSYANTATITSTETDPTPGNNTSTSTPVPVPVADVSITKTAGSGTPNVGSNVTFTLTATNAGPSSATNVNATDVLPSGYTFVSATPSGSTTYNNATGLWTIGTLANGANATLNIVATVKAAGSYANTVTITSTETDPTPGNNTSTSTPVPVPIADVSIAKTVNDNTPNVGSNVTFTLTASNAGPSSATNVSATDVLPSGYTFVSATPSGSTTYNATTGLWNIGTLTNGANATLNIVATVNATGSYANTATITATETDPTPGNNTATSTPVSVPISDVSVVKTVNNATPNVGSNVTFTVTAANAGPSAATNVSINDLLPSGYTFVSATPSGSTTYNNATGVWTIGTLANGANATLNIVATVKATGNYANTASITATETDPTPGNNTATSTPVPVPVADVSIAKTSNDASPNVGSNVTFTLTAANAGPSAATNVSATDVLPSGYIFVSATPSGTTTYNNTTGAWAIGTLANGANATLSIIATVNATGNYANTATITSTETDPTPGNNTSTSTPVPVPVADVSVTKTTGSGTPNVGSNVTFTLTAANAGPSDATTVKVNDLLPNGYAFVSATPSGTTIYNSTTGVWTIGTLANGANATLSIIATVKATGNYANTATITATESDPAPGNNTATSTPVPVPVADVSIAKTVSNASPNVGTNVTFTLTAANAGPSDATAVNVNDLLPTGYTFVSATPSGTTTYNNTSGAWTIGTLTNGANATLSIIATVNATGNYANTATITATETDPTPTNNTSTSTPVSVPVADVSVTKTVSNTTPNVGSNVTFTLTAANGGPSAATAVSVNDLLPSGYTFVSATPSGSTAYNNGTGAWTIGTLANGASATLSIVATVKATGNYANTASISATESDPTPGNNTSTSTPVPVPVADVSIAKTVSNASPNVGSNVTFTLIAANAGPSAATNVNINDLLPTGYTFVSATAPAGTTYNNTTGVWNIGTLANGVNTTLSVIATVNATGNYANTATITATETDLTPANNTSTSTPAPVPVADVSVTKVAGNGAPNVGSNVTFTLTAANAGPSDATTVKVNDLLPNGYTFVSATPSGTTTYNNGTGVWTIGTLANGANATLNVVATVKATGNYANTASITATESDPTPGNNTSTFTPVPVPVADVSVVKTVSNTSPNVGSNVTFTLTAANAGPSDATTVKVNDLLPTGYTFVSATAAAGTTYNNTTGVWDIGTLANGVNTTLSITATVNATGNYANTATITATETDPTPGNNTSTSTPVSVPVADVSVTKTVSSSTPNVGSNITFTLTAANAGPSDATTVKVNDLLPSGYTFVSATPSGATTYNNGTGLWTIGTLANSSNATLSIVVTVKATGNYANTASISATESDPVPGNNTSTSTPVPVPVVDVSVVKTVSNATPNAGSNVTFTLTAANAGPSTATGVNVNDLLPSGYTFVSATAPAGTTYNNATGVWTIGTLASGVNTALSVTATVNATGSYANTATITATETDPTPGNNTSTSTPVPVAVADVSITKLISKASPNVGSNITFTLSAANAGPSAATAVVANDLLPVGYTFVSATPSGSTTYNNTTGVWTIGTLANGANATLSIVAKVNATGNYTNAATISATENDPNTTNNTASAGSSPVDVKIVKTGPATANAGTTVTYNLTISNDGTGNAVSNLIQDAVPATLTNVSWTATASGTATINTGANGTGNNVSINANIPAGGSNTITVNITGQIPANSVVASLSNTASVTSPDPSDPVVNSNTVTTTINKTADIQIQKTGPGAVVAGNGISYTLNVTNAGPGDAGNVNVVDNIPAGISNVTWTATAQNGASITGATNGTGNVNLFAAIPAGTASVTILVNGTVDASYTGTTLVNTATATPEAGVTDPTPATSTINTNVTRVANVRITKSGPTNIGAGEAISYTLHIVNAGPSNATGVIISDPIPAQVLNPTWTATVQNGASVSANNGTGSINITGDIPSANGTIDIVISGTVSPAVADGSNFVNTATANLPVGSPITDPEASSNTSTVQTTVNNTADIRVSKNGPANVNILDPITYTIVVTNAGLGNVTGALINDNVPGAVTVSSWSASGTGGATITGTASGNTNTIATTGDIPADPNAKITITVQGTVNTSAGASFTNTVTVTAGGNPQSSVTTSVNGSTDVLIEKNGTQSAVAGSNVSYTLKVSNNGPVVANGVTVNDLVPADIENVTWTAAAFGTASLTGANSGNTNTVQTTGDVPVGTANYLLITVNGKIKSSATAASINNTASVTLAPGGTDYDLSNQNSTATTAVTKESDLSVVKTVSNGAPVVGSNITFTIAVANAGLSDATAVTVTDLLPSGYTFVSATPGTGTYNNATGVWTIGNLTNGANSTLSIVATVNATGNYTNTATISAAETDPNTANNSSSVVPVPSPLADVAVTKTASNTAPNVGSNVTFTVTATNAGPSAATGVSVQDMLLSGYTFVSASAPAGTNYDNTTGSWTIGNLANGGNAVLTITAKVNATGLYSNTATIAATENDPNVANNTITITPAPIPIADISIVKAISNAAPTVGSTVVFTLTAANAGPSDATTVAVNDLLPTGYTFVSASAPAGTSYNNASGVWTIGTLANGVNTSLAITATVNATGNYTNTATISAVETDPATGNNSSTVTPAPIPVADVTVVKTVNNATPNVGSNIIFSITASNSGPSASTATGVSVNDVLTSGYTFVSASAPAGTSYDNVSGQWTIGSLANGANAVLTITAKVNATGSYSNTATITANENDPNSGNNTSTITPAPVPVADIAVNKTVSNMAPSVGTNVTFNVMVSNAGPSAATGVTVNDLLPNGYTFVSATAPTGTTYNNTTGVWSIGNLANGSNATLNVVATVNATGTYTNSASASVTETDPVAGNNTSSVTPVPVPVSNVSVVKTVDNATPNVGSNVVFTIKASNAGPSAATNIMVNDVLQSGYTFVSASFPAGTNYDNVSGLWTITSLANGANSTLAITAKVNATGSYANTATITATENDPTPGDNSSTITPTPVPIADISVNKTVSNLAPAVGTNVTFNVTVSNAGPSAATGVTVNDLLPNGYNFVSATAPAGTTYNNTTGVWSIGNLTNGANTTLNVVATVNATGNYTNTAVATATETDPVTGNNTSSVTPVPVPVSNVSVVKTVDNPTPNAGSNVVFTIKATNAGPSAATGVMVNDVLQNGYTFVSANVPAGTIYDNATGLWILGSLANGTSASLTITAKVNPTGTYVNTATITATENDPNPGDNVSTITPVPVPIADVAVTKTVSTATPAVGSTVNFTLTARNTGPSQATGVIVTDLLPGGYTFVSASAPAGTTYNNTTGVWNIGSLGNGVNTILTITATVNATGNYTNTASINATETDPAPGNNNSSVTPVPVPMSDVSVVKTVDIAAPNVGSNVVFTLKATNAGPSAATGIMLSDVIPSGYTFVSASAPAGTSYDNTNGIWNIGSLANGANATLTITAKVNASGSYANTANVTATEGDPTPGNNSSTVTPVPVAVADVAITKTVSTATPAVGSTVNFTLTASNTGPSTATAITVTDLLSSGYTFVSASAPAGTTYNSTTGVWNIGSLDHGVNTVLTITATVNATGNYTNTASITATETDPTPGNNSSSVTPVPVPMANVSVIKTIDNTAPNVGNNVVFTIKATNTGPSTASGVIVNDVLPNGYTFVSAAAPAGTSYNNATGLWTIGNLTNGTTVSLAITARVNATGMYANTALITAIEGDPVQGDNSSTVTPVPVPVADVTVTKTVNNATPAKGNNVTFSITVNNNGPSTATNVITTDVLPSGYTFVSANVPAGTSFNNATGIWNIGTMETGTVIILTVTARVNESGTYANTATVTATETDPVTANNSATVTPVPTAVSNLSISKTVNVTNPTVGSNVVFSITVKNAGPSDANTVTATDILPGGYTFVSASAPTGTAYNNATGVWTIGSLANGATATLTVTAKVNASGSYANTASITSPVTDPDPANNSATVTPVPIPLSNLSVIKTVDKANPNVGSNVVFTIVTSNAGPSTATGVAVTDILQNGYTFVSATAPAGTSYSVATGIWTIGNLANGASAGLTITAKVNAKGNYANTATVNSAVTDPDPANNSSTVTPVPGAIANIFINKTVNTVSPSVGNNVVFNINVVNEGPSDATAVTATDLLPSGYTFVSASVPAGTTYSNTTGIWNIGNLANGVTVKLGITARVNATGNYANTASVASTTNDPDLTNNTSTSTPVPMASANLSVSKTVDNTAPTVGNNVVFSIRAANAGPSNATGVTVIDQLPNGYTFVSANAPTGTSYNAITGLWTIGNLANGAELTLSITAKVNTNGNYANTAAITATTADPASGDNTSTSTPVPVVNKPVAENDVATTNANKPIVIPVITNDHAGNSTLDPTTIEIVDQPKHGTVKVNGDGTVTYTPNPGYTGEDSFTYRVKDQYGNYTNVASVTIKSDFVDIKVPNLFTPNGDGTNDTFEIRGLNQFAQNNLLIVNRWGNEVYRSDNYQNNWTGEGLNEGTYYYLLKVRRNDGSDWVVYKGWLTLIRTFKK